VAGRRLDALSGLLIFRNGWQPSSYKTLPRAADRGML
jgi:hypothetical protein